MRTDFILILVIMLALLIAQAAAAHNEQQSNVVGNYKVEFWTVPSPAQAGQSTVIILALEDKENNKRISGFTAFVRISDGNKVLFSSNLEQTEPGTVELGYVFSHTGTYTVDFKIKELNLSTSFRVPIGEDSADYIILLLIIIIIAASAYAIWKRKAARASKEETP